MTQAAASLPLAPPWIVNGFGLGQFLSKCDSRIGVLKRQSLWTKLICDETTTNMNKYKRQIVQKRGFLCIKPEISHI
jgi:hypothetical protein